MAFYSSNHISLHQAANLQSLRALHRHPQRIKRLYGFLGFGLALQTPINIKDMVL